MHHSVPCTGLCPVLSAAPRPNVPLTLPCPVRALQLMSRRIYGPIWKSTFGHYQNINIGSPVVLEQLLRQEGKYPMRSDMALWKEHRDTRRLPYGPFTE